MPKSPEELKAEELAALIQTKWPGYTVTQEWDIDDGWHFAITKSPSDRCLLVIRPEVLADWNPKQIIFRLEVANWMLVLTECKGKSVAYFTNQGFALKPWPK